MNVKQLFTVLVFLLCSTIFGAEEIKIGEEYIEPLKYPKFSLGLDYVLNSKTRKLENAAPYSNEIREIGGQLSIEAGLYKYLNGGALFFLNFPAKKDPVRIRLALFAKPYIPLGERFSLFARAGGGIGGWLAGGMPGATTNFFATVGLEVFPFSRVGIALEGGWRGEIAMMRSSEDHQDGPRTVTTSFFFAHEIPVSLNLHIIL